MLMTCLSGMGGLHAHGGGQPVAHGAEPARGEPRPRVLELVVLRGPHLVLAHAGDDHGLAAGEVGDLLDHVLGLDDVVAPVVAERLGLASTRRSARATAAAPRGRPPASFSCFTAVHQRAQHPAAVAHDRDVDLDVLGDRRGIDVDVDDLGVRREGVDLAGDPIVEAGAHRDQHVGVVHGEVRVVGPVHAEHLQRQRVLGRERPQAHQRGGDRDLRELGQLAQLGAGVGRDHAAADVEHRLLGADQRAGRPLDLPGMAVVVRVVGAHHDLLGPDELRLLDEDVLGQIDVHRTGPARSPRCETPRG